MGAANIVEPNNDGPSIMGAANIVELNKCGPHNTRRTQYW